MHRLPDLSPAKILFSQNPPLPLFPFINFPSTDSTLLLGYKFPLYLVVLRGEPNPSSPLQIPTYPDDPS